MFKQRCVSVQQSPSLFDLKFAAALDSVGGGSESIRFGSRIVLPCYARLRSLAEAAQFSIQRLQPFELAKTTTGILWDTKFGKELLETMVLSKNVC